MRNRIRVAIFAVGMFGFAVVAPAQTPAPQAAPPTLKGKPVPRTADGKPDLTGFWAEWRRVNALADLGALYAARQKEINGTLPRTPPEQWALTPWAAERLKYNIDPLFLDDDGKPAPRIRNELDPSSHCFPSGTARLAAPFQIFQIPGQVWMIYQENTEVRQIFTDGRKHPEGDALELTWNGHAIGSWEGDTLVVDTVGMRDETLLDGAGHVHSDQLRIVQRIRRIAYDVLQVETTFTDPKALTRPYKEVATYPLAPSDWDLLQDIKCEEKFQKGIWFGEGPSGL
jgi:hypothetical protein